MVKAVTIIPKSQYYTFKSRIERNGGNVIARISEGNKWKILFNSVKWGKALENWKRGRSRRNRKSRSKSSRKRRSRKSRTKRSRKRSRKSRSRRSRSIRSRKSRSRKSRGKENRKYIVRNTKKYMNRPSPPIPANKHCGEKRKGNDGRMYKSVPNVRGICRWVKV